MEAYLDNSATTQVLPCVRDIMVKTMMEDYGNPSAKHLKGVEAEKYVKNAAEIIANTLKVLPKEIIFTSGGSESNNMALIETAFSNKRFGTHIISTGIEHASVYKPLAFLEEQGFRVTYLPVNQDGHIDLKELEDAVGQDTILVSIMYVNNEIGTVQPIQEISRIIKEKNSRTLFHVDGIQAYGKFIIRPKTQGIDLLSVSGHKFHGPKGAGFLYVNEKVKIRPLIYGGGQQRGLRSGTENVPGIAGLGEAAREAYKDFQVKISRLYDLKDNLSQQLLELEGVGLNSKPGTLSAPQIVSASFEGIRSEVLLHALEERGIYVSSGSACSSNHPGVSGTLKGIGLKPALLDGTIRISFGWLNTREDVDYCIRELKEILPILRRYQRG